MTQFSSIAKGLNVSEMVDHLPLSEKEFTFSSKLEKGILNDSFGSDYDRRIKKTGLEIKGALEKMCSFLDKKKEECEKEMERCRKEAGAEPTTTISSYMLRGMESQMKTVPKVYSYSNIEKGDKSTSMRDYNNAAERYVDFCIECLIADTLTRGLSDTEIVYLTVRSAAGIGV